MPGWINLHSRIHVMLEADDAVGAADDKFFVDSSHAWEEIEKLQVKATAARTFPTLNSIYLFDDMAKTIENTHKDIKLFFVVKDDVDDKIIISFLIGCHLVMSHGLGFEETYLSFKPWHNTFDQYMSHQGISLKHLLRSFCCAKCLDWIDFGISPSVGFVSQVMIDKLIHDEGYVAELTLIQNFR